MMKMIARSYKRRRQNKKNNVVKIGEEDKLYKAYPLKKL